jgi:uncharacterized protein
MHVEAFEVETPAGRLPARQYPAHDAVATLVFAHGAGAGQTHPWVCARAADLRARGVSVVTFDFPYKAVGRRMPDRAPVMVAAFRTVLAAVERRVQTPVVTGGKSMGGRMATMLTADDDAPPVLGVVAMGYPLHPPGRPEQLRVAHLPRIAVPVLIVQGTSDPFGTPADVQREASAAGASLQVVPVPGGHSFEVPKRGGTQQAVFDLVADQVRAWIDRLLAPRAQQAEG